MAYEREFAKYHQPLDPTKRILLRKIHEQLSRLPGNEDLQGVLIP